jgi:hypothetical protein
MKRIPNIQFTSPEADRKVMLVVSIVIMTLFGIFFAALLTLAVMQQRYLGMVIFSVFILLITYQLVRYFRELRQLRASK